MKPISLQTKMIFAFLMIALTPIGILAYVNYQTTRAALTRSANQALFAAASQIVTRIDSFLSTTLEITHNSARLPDLEAYLALSTEQRAQSDLKNRVLHSLFALKDRDFYISSCAILDAQGENILDTLPANIGRDEAGQLYFQMTLNTRGDYISPIEFPRQKGSVAFYVSSPIRRNSSGTLMEIIGVLRVRYNVTLFQQLVSQSTGLIGAQSYALLLNEQSLILAHSATPEFLFTLVKRSAPGSMAGLQTAQFLPNRPLTELYLNAPTLEFTEEEKEALHSERFHHTHPRVQLKMEALWLKSQALPHNTICQLTCISKPTLCQYLKDYQQGGIDQLQTINFYQVGGTSGDTISLFS